MMPKNLSFQKVKIFQLHEKLFQNLSLFLVWDKKLKICQTTVGRTSYKIKIILGKNFKG